MDNSMICYISLRYCIGYLYSICFSKLFFLYKNFIDYDNNIHHYAFIFSIVYLIYHFVFLLPFACIAFYVFHKKNNKDCHIIYNYLWHGCCGLLLAYSLIV